jgi:hypothetical protein
MKADVVNAKPRKRLAAESWRDREVWTEKSCVGCFAFSDRQQRDEPCVTCFGKAKWRSAAEHAARLERVAALRERMRG